MPYWQNKTNAKNPCNSIIIVDVLYSSCIHPAKIHATSICQTSSHFASSSYVFSWLFFFRATRRNWSVARSQDTVVWSPTTGRCPPGPAQIWWCWVCQGCVGKHCLSPMETYISFSFRSYKCYYKALTSILLVLTTLICHEFGFQSLFWSWLLIYS